MIALEERFWPKVERSEDHWTWIGARDHHGYGRIQRGGRDGGLVKAHRLAYELVRGPIPEGLELDHLCRMPSCVNPWHLEPVTHHENMRRAMQDTCRRGHPWTVDTTIIIPKGTRLCRTCSRARWKRKSDARREERHRLRALRERA